MARQSARLLTAILRPLVAEGIGSQHKVIRNKFLSKRYIHGAFNGGNQSSKFCNSFMTRERHFASRSKGGVDDEDIYDDVESRLMHDDDRRGDAYMDGMGYDVHGADYNASGEWDNAEAVSGDAEGEGSVDGEGSIEDSDEDSDESTANEMSDEEFEGGDQTDEELDELLANTPLFEPPEFPEFLRPGETVPEFSFRPEGPVYYPGGEYEPEELDITRPLPPRKRPERIKPEISVEEVIDNADFRVRKFHCFHWTAACLCTHFFVSEECKVPDKIYYRGW
ncbi:hypothetical protein KP509_32G021000 [Ceratopteris richardii]|uniref:Uncharacterized protein n=1 Tax=Ceratopteris richardii TaxID=49495 RepID=A0A8T2QS71_CERRI|nr:hypothetical protein KP509_32G021000 [Ceratopteris richardii]